MSRVIKFRVWEVVTCAYTKSHVIDGDGRAYLKPCWIGDSLTPVMSNSVIVEQFTGLTDSKGREIWEGDIISFVGGIKGAVSFGEFADSDGDEVVGWYMEGPHWNAPQVRHRYSLSSAMTSTVVGNIHEIEDISNSVIKR